MRYLTWALAPLLAMLPCAHGQSEPVASIGRLVFENGGEIPDTKVGYVTWGKLKAEYAYVSETIRAFPTDLAK